MTQVCNPCPPILLSWCRLEARLGSSQSEAILSCAMRHGNARTGSGRNTGHLQGPESQFSVSQQLALESDRLFHGGIARTPTSLPEPAQSKPGAAHFPPLCEDLSAQKSQLPPALRPPKKNPGSHDIGPTTHIRNKRCLHTYTVKVKVRMPPRIPNVPPPQLECLPPTAKNHSVRMPPAHGKKSLS